MQLKLKIDSIEDFNLCQRYKIGEVIGHGAYGKVFKATDIETGKVVAIKKIVDIQKDSYHTRMALREITIMRHLQQEFNYLP